MLKNNLIKDPNTITNYKTVHLEILYEKYWWTFVDQLVLVRNDWRHRNNVGFMTNENESK